MLQADSKPVFAQPGYLLFIRQNVLMAQRFDTRRRELEGDAVPVGQQVRTNPSFGSAAFSASDNGVLAYGGGLGTTFPRLEWIERDGRASIALEGSYDYRSVSLSLDGTRALVHRHEEESGGGLWLTDLARAATSRFTLTTSHDANAVRSPDGTRVAFASNRDDKRNAIYVKASNGSGDETQLLKAEHPVRPSDGSSDGEWMAYDLADPKAPQVWLLPLGGDRQPRVLAATALGDTSAKFSPDGKYVAYFSNESKRFEIHLQSLAQGGGKWQISTAGGYYPRWRRDGSELYYLAPNQIMMAVSINLRGATPVISAPRALFQTRAQISADGISYAVNADGTRFLVANQPEQAASTVTVVLNWHAELSRR